MDEIYIKKAEIFDLLREMEKLQAQRIQKLEELKILEDKDIENSYRR